MQVSTHRARVRAALTAAALAWGPGCAPSGALESEESTPHDKATLGRPQETTANAGTRLHSAAFAKAGAALTAHNSSLNARLNAGADGMTFDLLPSTGDAAELPEVITIRTLGIARGTQHKVTAASPFELGACASDAGQGGGACVQRAEARHGDVVEWWENRAQMVEHGFDIATRPWAHAPGPLQVEVQVLGADAQVRNEGALADLKLPSGRTLYYGNLLVTDARGDILPSRLVQTAKAIAIEVDDQHAAYPVRIDPAISATTWAAEPSVAYGLFGTQVASAGDVNGDGYGDVIVGAPGTVSPSINVVGRAYLYLGSKTGLSTTPAFQIGAALADPYFGTSVSGVGDLNGDGLDDVAIGSPSYSQPELNEGRVCILLGTKLGTTGVDANSFSCRESNRAGAKLGKSVAAAGDVNGDNLADLIVGAPGLSNGETAEGAAYVYYGTAAAPGLALAPAWVHEGNLANARMGSSVAGAGDVEGSGFGDVVVGGDRSARVFYGSATGLPSAASWTSPDLSGADTLDLAVAAAGDLNGDSYADVLVGVPDGSGTVQIYRGSIAGLAGFPTPITITPALANPVAGQPTDGFGSSVASAGDINADGLADFLIGAPRAGLANGTSPARGAIFVMFGARDNTFVATRPFIGTSSPAQLGYSVASAGDVNGDGLSDLLAGAPNFTGTQTLQGGAYAWYSNSAAVASPPVNAQGRGVLPPALSPGPSPGFGAPLSHVGDINGDGFGDAVFGDPTRSNGQSNEGGIYVQLGGPTGISTVIGQTIESNLANVGLGANIAAAGDVNADGYADVLVNSINGPNAQTNLRGVYLYLGSSSGLSTSPWWWTQITHGALGGAMTGSGDINGDGYADIAIGEPNYSSGAGFTNEGRFSVYFGGASTMTAMGSLRSQVANALLGTAMAMGDANGDGFSDLVVGAPGLKNGNIANHGTAVLYMAAGGGLSTTPIWTGNPNLTVSASYGNYLAFGDVTGDGRDDVLVGAPNYGATAQDRNSGAVYLYVASSAGILPTAPSRIFFGGTAGIRMGAVSVGDLSGDGIADVAMGAYADRTIDVPGGPVGCVQIFVGPLVFPGGVIVLPDPDFYVLGDRANYGLGVRVDLAGDLNGDGFADLLTGAPFTGTLIPVGGASGRAYALLGHSRTGRPTESVAQLRRTGTATPIVSLGRSFSTAGFDVAFKRARAASRNGYARVEVEAKAAGTAFNASTLIKGAWTQLPAGGGLAKVNVASAGLGTAPHVRARLAYHPGRTLPWMRASAWSYLGVPGHPQSVATRLR